MSPGVFMPIIDSTKAPGAGCYRRVFPGRMDQLSEVRAFIREHLDGHASASDVVLVANELSTNAWAHTASGFAGGTFNVQLELRPDDTVRLEVGDDGGPTRFGGPSASCEGGRGLAIVAGVSVEWGVTGDSSGRRVWVEFKP